LKGAADLRIIAGVLKGRRLILPKDSKVRPTTDKVKEALFSMLAPYLQDSVVIDLFSGTGSLGLEAISRGAKQVFFGDKSRTSLALTKANIAHCNVLEQCVTLLGDWEYVLRRIKGPVDLIILDPPYKAGLLTDCIERISELSLIKEDGIIVAEHGTDVSLPVQIGQFILEKEKRYGTIVISLYALSTEE
jgi:16S rRNA (guanine(966)-N(2))-methyltransferase RsmD